MKLRNFPFDNQICRLSIGLYGHFDREVKLQWSEESWFPPGPNATVPSILLLNSDAKLTKWQIKDVRAVEQINSEFQGKMDFSLKLFTA
jgi:hypothetical protein